MKKLFFSLCLTLFFTIAGFAQSEEKSSIKHVEDFKVETLNIEEARSVGCTVTVYWHDNEGSHQTVYVFMAPSVEMCHIRAQQIVDYFHS